MFKKNRIRTILNRVKEKVKELGVKGIISLTALCLFFFFWGMSIENLPIIAGSVISLVLLIIGIFLFKRLPEKLPKKCIKIFESIFNAIKSITPMIIILAFLAIIFFIGRLIAICFLVNPLIYALGIPFSFSVFVLTCSNPNNDDPTKGNGQAAEEEEEEEEED